MCLENLKNIKLGGLVLSTDLKQVKSKERHSKLGIIAALVFISFILPAILTLILVHGFGLKDDWIMVEFKWGYWEILFLGSAFIWGKCIIPVLAKVLSVDIILFLSAFFGRWSIISPIVAILLSIIDLKKPNRARILPKTVLVLSGILIVSAFITSIITTIQDLNRLFNL
jgi:hypothetical protein